MTQFVPKSSKIESISHKIYVMAHIIHKIVIFKGAVKHFNEKKLKIVINISKIRKVDRYYSQTK